MKLKPKDIKIASISTENIDEFDSFLSEKDNSFQFQYIDTEKPKIQVIDTKKKKVKGLF